MSHPSEASRYVHLVESYLTPDKNVIDVGSGGYPVVPHALQVDLKLKEFESYTNHEQRPPVQWRLTGTDLPFKKAVADVLFSSHLIEDFHPSKTLGVLEEWARVVKEDGHLIILHPDRDIFNHCVRNLGHTPNCAHKAERKPGELSAIALQAGLKVIQDSLTNLWENDYNILSIFLVPTNYHLAR